MVVFEMTNKILASTSEHFWIIFPRIIKKSIGGSNKVLKIHTYSIRDISYMNLSQL